MKELDVLVPTCERPVSLAVTLTGLCFQTYHPFHLIISDQSEKDISALPEIKAVIRVLVSRGNTVSFYRHLPKRGIAEQREFLLGLSRARFCLFLDDDLLLEQDVLSRLLKVIVEEGCGFAGSAPIGLSYIKDERPSEQAIEFWNGRVMPEKVLPGSIKWQRHQLHNAANILHVQKRMKLSSSDSKRYKVAWIGGCVLYDRKKLQNEGGFAFWKELPRQHCGEDVLAQLRLMACYGGCGVIPSGVYHLELPTTVKDRRVNAARIFSKGPELKQRHLRQQHPRQKNRGEGSLNQCSSFRMRGIPASRKYGCGCVQLKQAKH